MTHRNWRKSEQWLREQHATEDFIHACRVTAKVRDPLRPSFVSDLECKKFKTACRRYIRTQPAAVQAALIRESGCLGLCSMLHATRRMRKVNLDGLPNVIRKRHQDRLNKMRVLIENISIQEPKATEQETYWEKELRLLAKALSSIPDDAGTVIEFTPEEIEILKAMERDYLK
jgi:hypothetical protein